jgi:hypothetical protein
MDVCGDSVAFPSTLNTPDGAIRLRYSDQKALKAQFRVNAGATFTPTTITKVIDTPDIYSFNFGSVEALQEPLEVTIPTAALAARGLNDVGAVFKVVMRNPHGAYIYDHYVIVTNITNVLNMRSKITFRTIQVEFYQSLASGERFDPHPIYKWASTLEVYRVGSNLQQPTGFYVDWGDGVQETYYQTDHTAGAIQAMHTYTAGTGTPYNAGAFNNGVTYAAGTYFDITIRPRSGDITFFRSYGQPGADGLMMAELKTPHLVSGRGMFQNGGGFTRPLFDTCIMPTSMRECNSLSRAFQYCEQIRRIDMPITPDSLCRDLTQMCFYANALEFCNLDAFKNVTQFIHTFSKSGITVLDMGMMNNVRYAVFNQVKIVNIDCRNMPFLRDISASIINTIYQEYIINLKGLQNLSEPGYTFLPSAVLPATIDLRYTNLNSAQINSIINGLPPCSVAIPHRIMYYGTPNANLVAATQLGWIHDRSTQ